MRPTSCSEITEADIDPSGVLLATAHGIYGPGCLTFASGIAPVSYGFGTDPPAGPDTVIGSSSVPIVNTLEVPALCILSVSLTANNLLHGSAGMSVVVEVGWDGVLPGSFQLQVLHGLLGPISTDPALGGDGSLTGRNSAHHDVTTHRDFFPGDGFAIQPATIAPGASHTLDLEMRLTAGGLWNDPANPDDNGAIYYVSAGAVLLPAG